jgi:hypothetical protein
VQFEVRDLQWGRMGVGQFFLAKSVYVRARIGQITSQNGHFSEKIQNFRIFEKVPKRPVLALFDTF